MANIISQVELASGIYDLQAKYDGSGNEITATYAPKSEWETFKSAASFGTEAIDTLKEIQEYIDSDKESAAAMLESIASKSVIGHTHTVKAKGNISQPEFTGTESKHSHTFTGTQGTISTSYTPAGNVSKPEFTGTEGTISASYTPVGTVSKPEFSGKAVNSGAVSTTTSGHTTTVQGTLKSAGSFPTLNYTAPTCSHVAATFTPNVTNGVLSFSFTGGSISFSAGSASLSGGAMPTYNSATVPSTSHTHSVTAQGTVTQPEFTGTSTTISTKYTPIGSVSKPTFTGIQSAISATYTPEGTISETAITPAGIVSKPTFTGTTATTNGSTT